MHSSSYQKSVAAAQKLLSGKYTILILNELTDGSKNYNTLLKSLDITSPTLTRSLKEMEEHHLIRRVVLPSSPVRVEYSLTTLGEEFRSSLECLSAWGAFSLSEKT